MPSLIHWLHHAHMAYTVIKACRPHQHLAYAVYGKHAVVYCYSGS